MRHTLEMDQDNAKAPPGWEQALARGDADIARGDTVPASVIHDELLAGIAEMEAELAAKRAPADPTLP